MNILMKTILRWAKSIRFRLKLFSLKLMYGNQIEFSRFNFRNNLRIVISKKGRLKIGNGVFFNNGCSINVLNKIHIGNNCAFGENVKLYDHNHKYKDISVSIKKQGFTTDEIIIEDDCWIGSNVVILKGVHIGKHSIIGAGCVIYEDIPENSVTVCKQNLITTRLK